MSFKNSNEFTNHLVNKKIIKFTNHWRWWTVLTSSSSWWTNSPIDEPIHQVIETCWINSSYSIFVNRIIHQSSWTYKLFTNVHQTVHHLFSKFINIHQSSWTSWTHFRRGCETFTSHPQKDKIDPDLTYNQYTYKYTHI